MKKILIFLALFAISSNTSACSFIPREYSEIYQNSENIFIGIAIEEKKINPKDGKTKFKVLETLKGKNLEKDIELSDPMFGTSCQKFGYTDGKFLIISMNNKNEISEINMDKSFESLEKAQNFFQENFPAKSPENPEKIKPKEENMEKQNIEVIMKGPTSAPNIIGPKSAPPTRAEINKMKAKAEGKSDRDGLGFWAKVWDWIINLFN